MQTKMLTAIPATPESVAPFGMLIDVPADGVALPVAFYEGKVRVYKPAQFKSDEDTEITLASIDPRDMSVHWLERHFKHTQTSIPLSNGAFVIVMAPSTDGDLPDIDQARVLVFDGRAGFALHVGTWHEPFSQAL